MYTHTCQPTPCTNVLKHFNSSGNNNFNSILHRKRMILTILPLCQIPDKSPISMSNYTLKRSKMTYTYNGIDIAIPNKQGFLTENFIIGKAE